MVFDVIKGLALATRTDAFTGHLEAFLTHHLKICERAFVLIDHRPEQDISGVIKLLESFYPRVTYITHICANFDNGKTCLALSDAISSHPEYDVVLHVDKDEFVRNIGEIEGVVARIRAGESDYAEGRMVCRFGPGGESYYDNFRSYEAFCEAAPVRADIVHSYGFPSVKCCLNRAPAILIHYGRKGWRMDKSKFNLEHFRWIYQTIEKTNVKTVQHSCGLANRIQWRDRMVHERTNDFLGKLKRHFRPLSWEIQGWMDYEDLFRNIVETIPAEGTFVELGVWKGRSISYFCEYATLLGKKVNAIGYDIFNPLYYQGKECSKIEMDGWFKEIDMCLGHNCPWNRPSLIRIDSSAAAELHEDQSVDALWIDANHSETSVINDITAWKTKIKKGGLLAGHDIDKTSVRSALRKAGLDYQLASKSSWICQF
jgi:hypothetical protein